MKRRYHVIGACSGWGAQLHACELGPKELAQNLVFERLKNEGLSLSFEMLHSEKQASHMSIPLDQSLPLVRNFNLQLFHAMQKAIKKGEFPIVIGGDHSIAVGTWNAFNVPFGLLWIDAHMDAHTLETSPSKAYHGMPLAALLGYGEPEMAQLIKKEAVLKPQNLALIGTHSFEKEEAAFLKDLNVKIYFLDEIKERGLKVVIPEAIEYITRGISHYGVSLDLDVFSVEDAPGVGSPEKGGISKNTFMPLISIFSKDERLIGFEMAEYNPERDMNHRTLELAFEILQRVMRS